jgi:Chaperone for protein-folding within the ER, fungal
MISPIPGYLLLGLGLISSCTAQLVNDALVGTWTTKSKTVFTGPGFYNPVTDKLTEPRLPGISYSFTADGHYEEAYYRAIANRELCALVRPTTWTKQTCSPATGLPVCDPAVAARHLHPRSQWLPHSHAFCRRRASSHVESLLIRPVCLHTISPSRTDEGTCHHVK